MLCALWMLSQTPVRARLGAFVIHKKEVSDGGNILTEAENLSQQIEQIKQIEIANISLIRLNQL